MKNYFKKNKKFAFKLVLSLFFFLFFSIFLIMFFNNSVNSQNVTELSTISNAKVYLTSESHPIVNVSFPPNNYVSSPGNITFNYTIDDLNLIYNCSLIINNKIVKTENNLETYTFQIFQYYLEEGAYNFSIICYNYANYSGESENRRIQIGFDEQEENERKKSSSGYLKFNQTFESSELFKICFSTLNNQSIEIFVGRKDLGVENITFFYEGYAKNPCLIIKKVPLEEIISKTDYTIEQSYKSFNVSLENFNESKIKNVTFITSINNLWLSFRENNSIILNKNKELIKEGWESQNSKFIFQEVNYSYFLNKFDNFSIFVITANLMNPPLCGDGICEWSKGETVDKCPEDCSVNGCCAFGICKSFFGICWYVLVIIGILSIGLIIFLIFKKIDEIGKRKKGYR